MNAQDEEGIATVIDPTSTHVTDPGQVEVGWTTIWERVTRDLFAPVPGVKDTVLLDGPARIIFEVTVPGEPVDPEMLLNQVPDTWPEEIGYAPGTVVIHRAVTEYGGWFAYQAGPGAAVQGVGGVKLFYTPEKPGDPLTAAIVTHLGDMSVGFFKQRDFGVCFDGKRLCHMAPYEDLFAPFKPYV